MSSVSHDDYCIALYYIYLKIPDIDHHLNFQRELCQKLCLKGRIRVAAAEGCNGVLSGRTQDFQDYENEFVQELCRNSNSQVMRTDLDLKYCRLRKDLPVQVQLFSTLVVKETKTVIGLVDLPSKDERCSHKSKKRQGKNTQGEVLSDSALVRQVYERVMEQFSKEEAAAHRRQGHKGVVESSSIHSQGSDSIQVPHLSPKDWDRQVAKLSEQPEQSVVFLDCRNVYESSVGHFQAPHAKTVLTNTRKFAELPQVLVEQSDQLSKSTHIFAYCTGGVRCELTSATC